MPRVEFEQRLKSLADGSLAVESFRNDGSVEELMHWSTGHKPAIWQHMVPGRFQDMAAGMPTGTDRQESAARGVGLPSRAPPIAPARPQPQQEFDMELAASET